MERTFLFVLAAPNCGRQAHLPLGPLGVTDLGALFLRHSDTKVTDIGAAGGYILFADIPRC
jgi:hypothetical protein